MTETRKRKGESVEDLDARIGEMEAELAEGAGRPLSWDEVTSTTADEIAAKEQRRGILPRLIRAARVKRLELELRDREREAETLREGLEPLYGAFRAKEDELEAGARGPEGRPRPMGAAPLRGQQQRRRPREADGPGAGRAEGGGVKDSSYEARRERRERERQAGEAFQEVLRERVDGPGTTLEDLTGRGKRKPEGGDDAR